jgi:hypothetical protein
LVSSSSSYISESLLLLLYIWIVTVVIYLNRYCYIYLNRSCGCDISESLLVLLSCSTSDIRRVNLVVNPVISHERGKNLEVFTTSGTYPWSFVTHIFSSSTYGFWLPLWYLQTLHSNLFYHILTQDMLIFFICHTSVVRKDKLTAKYYRTAKCEFREKKYFSKENIIIVKKNSILYVMQNFWSPFWKIHFTPHVIRHTCNTDQVITTPGDMTCYIFFFFFRNSHFPVR